MTLNSGVRRTLLVLLACALGALPLKAMFTDWGWLPDAWLAIIVVALPALLIRASGREPGALQIWPGLVLMLLWLTARFVPDHAVLGFFPGPGAWHDVSRLLDDLHDTTRSEVAPVASTPAIRLALALMLALLVALMDLIAIVGRRAALAGLPLLVVFTTAGAVSRRSVPWPLFVAAGAAFLLLLGMDARDDLGRWGHRVARREGSGTGRTLAVSGPRIGAVAIVAALILALIVPGNGKNLLSNLIRNGVGKGGGHTGTAIDPWAGLKGDLHRGKPVVLATVHVDREPAFQPFHLRTQVLDDFTGKGWEPGTTTNTVPLQAIEADLPTSDVSTGHLQATITIAGMTGAAPTFATTDAITGLRPDFRWDADRGVLVGAQVRRGDEYAVSAEQLLTNADELTTAAAGGNPVASNQWLSLPSVPEEVSVLVDQLTTGLSNPFAKASAIWSYFRDPDNGFKYSLSTAAGDSGSDLVDFLHNKQGFCQQFAASMGVMLRLAGVPARVVLGYAHGVPDANGNLTISSNDAHAWVEAEIAGVGWVPFDPTPLDGITGGEANELPYAPHNSPTTTTTGTAGPTATDPTARQTRRPTGGAGSSTAAPVAAHSSGGPGWTMAGVLIGALLVFALGAAPWVVRSGRTRRRLRDAAAQGPEPLWAELADTAKDLGYVWSPARTPRQVASWLAEPAGDAAPQLTRLAQAVEVARYARPGSGAGAEAADRTAELEAVRTALWAKLPRKDRWKARLLPGSVLPRSLGTIRRR